jgi:hypothetical protein
MKTTVFIFYFLFFGFIGYSQVDTKIIIVDLSKPHKKSITVYTDSLSTALDRSKWLSARSREMIAVKLINGNPLKYNYKIDTKSISFFNDPNTNAEKLKTDLKKNADSIFKLLSYTQDRDETFIKNIIDKNQELRQGIDSLSHEVKNLYGILKHKNSLQEKDYFQRKDFLNKGKEQLTKSYNLLNGLEKLNDNLQYEAVKNSVIETKAKAEKSIDSIIEKFYSINLEVYTPPLDVQGKNIDVVEFKLRRFDKATKEEELDFAPTPYNIWITGGLKIDLSAGLFFTSLYDAEYDKRDDPAISDNKIITLKNSGDYDLAFGSTINTYVRMNSWIVPTLNFGAVLTKNEKLQVLVGFGAILGKQERIIFSAGLAMGKVDRIADGYQVDSSYNLGDAGTIPTQSQFKFGHFFGITYNLSKVKKISLDKGIEEN